MYYAIFTAPDGKRYYLVNGWNKQKTFFTSDLKDCNYFKTIGSLKTSIHKLLKISNLYGLDYSQDDINLYITFSNKKNKESYCIGNYYI